MHKLKVLIVKRMSKIFLMLKENSLKINVFRFYFHSRLYFNYPFLLNRENIYKKDQKAK